MIRLIMTLRTKSSPINQFAHAKVCARCGLEMLHTKRAAVRSRYSAHTIETMQNVTREQSDKLHNS